MLSCKYEDMTFRIRERGDHWMMESGMSSVPSIIINDVTNSEELQDAAAKLYYETSLRLSAYDLSWYGYNVRIDDNDTTTVFMQLPGAQLTYEVPGIVMINMAHLAKYGGQR